MWYAEARARARAGCSAVLSGTVLPEDFPDASGTIPVRFCLLEASEESIATRLRSRYAETDAAEKLESVAGSTVSEFIDTVIHNQSGFRACFEQSSLDWFALDTSVASLSDSVREILSWIRSASP